MEKKMRPVYSNIMCWIRNTHFSKFYLNQYFESAKDDNKMLVGVYQNDFSRHS